MEKGDGKMMRNMENSINGRKMMLNCTTKINQNDGDD